MTAEEIRQFASNDWKYRRKSERNHWLRHPEEHRKYLAKSMTRGWAFLKVSAQSHEADMARIVESLKNWTPA